MFRPGVIYGIGTALSVDIGAMDTRTSNFPIVAMAVTLVPRSFERIVDWKAHYFARTRMYFVLQVASLLYVFWLAIVFSLSVYAPTYIILAVLLPLYAAAAVTKNERFHIGVTVAALIVGISTILPTI